MPSATRNEHPGSPGREQKTFARQEAGIGCGTFLEVRAWNHSNTSAQVAGHMNPTGFSLAPCRSASVRFTQTEEIALRTRKIYAGTGAIITTIFLALATGSAPAQAATNPYTPEEVRGSGYAVKHHFALSGGGSTV